MRHSIQAERRRVFQVEEIPVEVVWKSVRNMNLRLSRDGMMRASVPRRTTIAVAERFLAKNLLWMRSAIARSKKRGMPDMPEAVEGAPVRFFGCEYKLHIAEGRGFGLILFDGSAMLTVRRSSTAEAVSASLKDASRQLLQEAAATHFPYVETQTGLSASSWHIRDMKTRWGSCNVRTKRVCLNLRLVQKPLVCLDAVIAHELVHTKVSNHGRDFYALLNTVWPSWREAMELLELKDDRPVREFQ